MGDGDGSGEGARPKKTRDQWTPRKDGWTGKKRRLFLDTLAATCVARWAAKAAGMSYSAAAALRRRDPEFAEEWWRALIEGYGSLQDLVVEHSLLKGAPPRGEDDPAEPDPANIDAGLALQLLQMSRKRADGWQQPGRAPYRRASEAETDAAILKKLAALRRRLGLEPDGDGW